MRRATGSARSSTTTTTTTTNSPTPPPPSLVMTLRVPNRDELESTRNQMQAFAESDEGSDFASLPLFPGDQERTTVRDAFGMAKTDPDFQTLATAITTSPGVLQAVMDIPEVQNFLNSESQSAAEGANSSNAPDKKKSKWSRIRDFMVRGGGQRIWNAIRGVAETLYKEKYSLQKIVTVLRAFWFSILTWFFGAAKRLFG